MMTEKTIKVIAKGKLTHESSKRNSIITLETFVLKLFLEALKETVDFIKDQNPQFCFKDEAILDTSLPDCPSPTTSTPNSVSRYGRAIKLATPGSLQSNTSKSSPATSDRKQSCKRSYYQ